jgi:hypothetical protein
MWQIWERRYKVLVGKHETRDHVEKLGICYKVVNIKLHFKGVHWINVHWIDLAQEVEKWLVLINMETDLRLS